MKRLTAFIFLISTCAIGSAQAQQRQAARAEQGPLEIAKSGAWGVYTNGQGRQKVCYVLSQPAERLPKGLNRDPAYLFISNRPGDGARNEISVISGYPLKPGSEVTAAIGSASFQLLSRDKNAWLKNPAEESRFIAELRKGSALTIKGTSIRGNDTTDRYSLQGLNAALERAQKECS
jgi:hypothetical protein